jgi:hypothetical protein
MIAALYVETGGVYYGLPDVDPWDAERDARLYAGPYPVVAHPPCQRWGRFWHGSTAKPHQFRKGDDGGCFASALAAVRVYGGVLEHPADSLAWAHHGLTAPPRSGGWVKADEHGGSTCYVEQGHYGHRARKATWLYAVGCDLPALKWGPSPKVVLLVQRSFWLAQEQAELQRLKRMGLVGRMSKEERAATPVEFRDLLLQIARSAAMR